MIDEKELMELREKLQFEQARATLLENCDCGIPYAHLQWVLDYVKKFELGGCASYYSASEYILEALEPTLDELENAGLDEKENIRNFLKYNGLFEAVGNKMLESAKEDFEDISLVLNEVEFRAEPNGLYFSLKEFEKEEFIEEVKESNNPLKNELIAKHKALFEKLDIYSILKQEVDYSNQEQRAGRIRRQ
ncbi:hypothetical protein DY098_06425 [Campylobacter upsaliensis]|nr:hypothetical protein [Campylobacter upsaliensis]EAI4100980.1 hypothetical protein [Campylobacter jejuni]EAK0839279.1 hypothetical protein [Campylobacter upsaliensis]EAL3927071.1 hypothetical protein [Campylobacter upsaliensis]EAL8714786.1 hypothetical protein [Campylobacter upsaliensis]